MKSFLLTVAFALLNTNLIASQALTSCQQCYYGECESLAGNTYSCHCVLGVKGRQCEECLYPGDDLCLSNPCWNGGICQNLGNDFSCQCPNGASGKDCRTPGTSTNSPVANNATTTVRASLPDKYIRIKNKGGYTAILSVTYMVGAEQVTQIGSIASGQSYAFYVPGSVDYNSLFGANLRVKALAGNVVFQKRVNSDRECYDVWGTTLDGYWSSVNC